MHFPGYNNRKAEMVTYASNRLVVKKRSEHRDNEVFKVRKDSCHIAPSYGDRFIPRRYDVKRSIKSNHCHSGKQEVIMDILNWDLPNNYWLQHSLKDALDKCFKIKENRLLNFTDAAIQLTDKRGNVLKQRLSENKPKTGIGRDWSCNPRRKPYAYFETIHDSVGFINCFERNMMDWSVNGQVVASFENDVTIWRHIRDISITFNVESASCLAYCPKGKYLALGCKINDYPAIELWDVNKYTIKVEVVQRVFFNTSNLQIQCLEWSKCGRFLLSGTNKGTLYVFSVPKLKRVRVTQAHQLAVSTMRFSPTMRFLATGDIAGNIVIYDWFSFNVFLRVRCKPKSDIILDWHPWNGVELAIAENMPATVLLLHVPSKQITAYYRRKDRNVCIHSLTFNKITAELLLSISQENSSGIVELKIMVLASFDRVVDVLTMENGARFLMWDPEGTRVVTAGTDDSLTIWRFYPKNERKSTHDGTKPDQLYTVLKKDSYGCCDYGTRFRLWSTIK